MRPTDLPTEFPHGTRSRYVMGCRCRRCRNANRELYFKRQGEGIAAAMKIKTKPRRIGKLWTTPSGEIKIRHYRRACPGVNGKRCATHSHLRKDSKGGVCGNCRLKLAWNGLVRVKPLLDKLRWLSARGVGYKTVAAAADVSETTLAKIRQGTKKRVRKKTLDRVMSVGLSSRADHSLVPAKKTLALLEELYALGYTKSDIALRLGNAVPAIQFRAEYVLACTELKVKKLHRRIISGRATPPTSAYQVLHTAKLIASGTLRKIEIVEDFDSLQRREFFATEDGYSFRRLPRLKNEDLVPVIRKLKNARRRRTHAHRTEAAQAT